LLLDLSDHVLDRLLLLRNRLMQYVWFGSY
jgi:hypothetical protein